MTNTATIPVSLKTFVGVFAAFIASAGLLLRPLYAEPVTQKFILDNGMTVLITEIPGSPAVGLQAVFKTGSATEGKYLGSGISHFVEHMLFKGTDRRKVGEIAKEVKSLGGIINASTSFDYTSYTVELPAQAFKQGTDILADMIMHSRFDPEETEKEREVILGELRMHKDSPERRLNDLMFSNAYTRHPYRHPVIGYEPIFKMITRDQLFEYYQENYTPNNMVFSVAGNIEAAEAMEIIKNVFSDFQPRPCLMRNLPVEPVQVASRQYEENYTTDHLARMAMAFQGVSLSDRDMFALDVLAVILGQGETSRLYQNIIKKENLAYSMSASDFTPMDQGVFEISATLEGGKVQPAIAAIRKEIERIKIEGVAKEELERVKRQVLANRLFDSQKASDVASTAVMDEVFISDTGFSKKYVEAIRSLTTEDIKRVANRYLTETGLTTVILYPKKPDSGAKEARKDVAPSEIKKTVLENGLVVLLREDHTFPLVSVRLALAGGVRHEKDLESGLSNLTAEAWTKGTKTKTSVQIARMIEGRGMSLSSFSGLNSFGVECNLLSEDTEFALDLLEDLVKNPTFPEDEIRQDVERIKSGIQRRDDEIFSVSRKALRENLFATHPYRRETLGTLDSVSTLQRDHIISFYNKLAVANNMVLAIYGDINSDKMLAAVKSRFSGIAKKDLALPQYTEAPIKNTILKNLVMDKAQAVVMAGFQAPALNRKDRYACEVLSTLLGSPLNSRIFNTIRDTLGSAYRLGASYTPGIDAGWIYFYVVTTDKEAEKVKEVLLGQIEKVQQELVSEVELEDSKTYLKGTFAMSLETNSTLSYLTSCDELYGLGFNNYKSYEQAINAVTRDDLMRFAKDYLTLDKAVVIVTKSSAGQTPLE